MSVGSSDSLRSYSNTVPNETIGRAADESLFDQVLPGMPSDQMQHRSTAVPS